ncbi:MAG: hypothetical protein N3C12_00935 [Candidatus Binatia bacterium]|nr:hypothetical protein [Candidatus Binatia bacterium]
MEERIRSNIAYWEQRARELSIQESMGKQTQLSAQQARERAKELENTLARRLEEFDRQTWIVPTRPVTEMGFVVVPRGLLRRIEQRRVGGGKNSAEGSGSSGQSCSVLEPVQARRAQAVAVVMEEERRRGREPVDRSTEGLAYHIGSYHPEPGSVRFVVVLPVKEFNDELALNREELLLACNQPEHSVFACVRMDSTGGAEIRYGRVRVEELPSFEQATARTTVKSENGMPGA